MPKKLTIELIPSTSWNNNLRAILGKQKWQEIRNKVIKIWGKKCAICEKSTKTVDCHEVWEFKAKNQIQNLIDIIPLCKNCHAIKHLGLAELQNSKGQRNIENLISHYMKVNNCTRNVFEIDRKKAYKIFEKRSQISWRLAFNNVILT